MSEVSVSYLNYHQTALVNYHLGHKVFVECGYFCRWFTTVLKKSTMVVTFLFFVLKMTGPILTDLVKLTVLMIRIVP